jgi:hypothetical protein
MNANARVTCPSAAEWRALTAHRREASLEEPAGWEAAVEHLDGGCKACRQTALDADPTLVFRRLPAVEAGDADIAAMIHAVSVLRTASRIAPERRRGTGWQRWASAAALLLAALSSGSSPALRDTLVPSISRITEVPRSAAALPARMQMMPALEGLDRSEARIYQMEQDDFSVVMVVDPKFEGLEV